jgi:hypothetical protein
VVSVEFFGRVRSRWLVASTKSERCAKFNRRQIERLWDRSVRFHTGVEISD